jgi:hypothetical protein
MDIALDTATGDIRLVDGDLLLLDGADAVAQRLAIGLQTYQGEWFLDDRVGVPYLQRILVKNPNVSDVSDVLRRAILATPGVVSLDRFDLALGGASRTARLSFAASTTSGPVLFDRELILG